MSTKRSRERARGRRRQEERFYTIVSSICFMLVIVGFILILDTISDTKAYAMQEIPQCTVELIPEVVIVEDRSNFISIAREEAMLRQAAQKEKSMKGKLTQAEQNFIILTTKGEAEGEPAQGKLAVMAVILNRIRVCCNDFGKNAMQVCKKSGQFNAVHGDIVMLGERPLSVADITSKDMELFEEALKGVDPTEELLKQEAYRLGLLDEKYWKDGALHFSNMNENLSEARRAEREKISVKITIGNHTFWRTYD